MLDEERQRIVLNRGRISGIAPAADPIWRAGRRSARPLSTTLDWCGVASLSVRGRDEEEQRDTDLNDDDKVRTDNEHRARWVLDERAADAR